MPRVPRVQPLTAPKLAASPPPAATPPPEEPPRFRANVAATSAELAAELGQRPAPPVDFPSANRRTAEKPLRADFRRVVDTVMIEEDVGEVWKRLEKALRVGELRTDAPVLAAALDEAETNARAAHRLYITARLLHDEWELDNGHIFAKMRNDALVQLQMEKTAGQRSKQITDADILAECASMFEDEWREQEMRRKKSKATVETLQNLSDAWTSRCKTLQTLYGKAR